MHNAIQGIVHDIRLAAGDLEQCDSEALVAIARNIVRTVGRDGPEKLTDQERAVLCDTVDHLLGQEAFGRAPWRLQAAGTALRCVSRLLEDDSHA